MATLVISIALGVILIVGAIPKLRHPKGFVLTVWEYHILPRPAATLYARLTPVAELFLGLALLSGALVRPVAVLAGLLFASFTLAVALNAVRGRNLDCGCFGPWLRHRVGWPLVAQDAALTCACTATAILAGSPLQPWSPFSSLASPVAGLVVALGLCGVLAIVVSAALTPPLRRVVRMRTTGAPTFQPVRNGERRK